MRRAILFPLLLLATAARAEVEVGLGPNLQVAKGARPEATVGTGFVARGLLSTGGGLAVGLSLEGLWLVPTAMPGAEIVEQQDLVALARYRPPVGHREWLAVDLGAGVSHYSGARDIVRPTFQVGAALCGRAGARWSYELGARFAITPRLGDPDTGVMFAAPSTFATRFGGMLTARL
jgi:hypothetical protein